jgi:hypothetical protein
VTPEERSRADFPGEWIVDEEPIRVLLLVPVDADEDPVVRWLEETGPENWPVLPDDPKPRLSRALRILRNGIVFTLALAAFWGLIAGITWLAWEAAVRLS